MPPLGGDPHFLRMHTAIWQPDLARANGSATYTETWRLSVKHLLLSGVIILLFLGSSVPLIYLSLSSTVNSVFKSLFSEVYQQITTMNPFHGPLPGKPVRAITKKQLEKAHQHQLPLTALRFTVNLISLLY